MKRYGVVSASWGYETRQEATLQRDGDSRLTVVEVEVRKEKTVWVNLWATEASALGVVTGSTYATKEEAEKSAASLVSSMKNDFLGAHPITVLL